MIIFILKLTYIKPLSEIDEAFSDHLRFLETYYARGKFICSGRQNPRTGGIILCSAVTRAEAESISKEDPFLQRELVDYEIIEFFPSRCCADFEPLL